MGTYAIQFDFPEGVLWGGPWKGACGWAPTLATAYLFNDPDKARAMLVNGYGQMAEWGRVMQVTSDRLAIPA